jgi:ribonuclease J
MHGRKAPLVRQLMERPPEVDVLLMEGTNLGSDKPTKSESDLEEDFAALFRKTSGRVFVSWSAQNIDRTVSIYRACIKTNRTLAVDRYTAEVLELLTEHGRLPQAGWNNLKVVITRRFANLYRQKGRADFVDRMAQHGVSASALADNLGRWVVMMRRSLIDDFSAKGVHPTANDAWSFS